MDKELITYKEQAETLLQLAKIDIVDVASVTIATDTLSQLNRSLDRITEHKERKTKPLNEALKAIRADYKPIEALLEEAIATLRSNLTAYATEQTKAKQEAEERILSDKRLKPETQINKLAELTPTLEQVETDNGSITFTTTTKYRLIEPSKVPPDLLEINLPALKAHIKAGFGIPEGIEKYEEKSVRNFR